MNYLGKFFPSTAEVCESLQTALKYKWTWNSIYQNLHERAKITTERNATMAFYNEKQLLYLDTDAVGVDLGASLLQVRDGIKLPRN